MSPGSIVLELPDPELLPPEDSVLGSTSVVDEDELVAALDDPELLEDPSVPEPLPSPSQPPSRTHRRGRRRPRADTKQDP